MQIFLWNPWFIVLFYNVYKENMFTNEIEDGCKAPLKPSIKPNQTKQVILKDFTYLFQSLVEKGCKDRLSNWINMEAYFWKSCKGLYILHKLHTDFTVN